MAADNPTPPPAFGKFAQLIDIPFRCDSPHEERFASGSSFCVFEEVASAAVVVLVTPAAVSARPLRMMLTFDHALEGAHQLIAAAARLRQAGAS
jgi:hypothetical protein